MIYNYHVVLKQVCSFASQSLNHNIYIAVDPTPVDVAHAAHAGHCIVDPQCLLSESWRPTYFNINMTWCVDTYHVLNHINVYHNEASIQARSDLGPQTQDIRFITIIIRTHAILTWMLRIYIAVVVFIYGLLSMYFTVCKNIHNPDNITLTSQIH